MPGATLANAAVEHGDARGVDPALGQPFYGGFLVPAPTILLPNLRVDALGELDL